MTTQPTMQHDVPSLLDLPNKDLEPMSKELSQVFLSLLLAERQDQGELLFADILKTGDPMIAIISARFAHMAGLDNTVITPLVRVLCSVLAEGNPGRGVMLAHTMTVLHHRIGKPVTLEDIASEPVFGFGFPKDSTYSRVWDQQKIAAEDRATSGSFSDNWLDSPKPWRLKVASEAPVS